MDRELDELTEALRKFRANPSRATWEAVKKAWEKLSEKIDKERYG
jgi:hypothetical protein